MPIMEKTQTKKSIWDSLKEIFWDCDNICEEAPIKGDTPEDTAELLKARANADQKFANLSSSDSNSTKGGKGNSGKVAEVVTIDTRAAIAATKLKEQKVNSEKGKEETERGDK